MKRLLDSPAALALAWFVVVALLAGVAAWTFLQPPAPAGGEAVTIAVEPIEPPAEPPATPMQDEAAPPASPPPQGLPAEPPPPEAPSPEAPPPPGAPPGPPAPDSPAPPPAEQTPPPVELTPPEPPLPPPPADPAPADPAPADPAPAEPSAPQRATPEPPAPQPSAPEPQAQQPAPPAQEPDAATEAAPPAAAPEGEVVVDIPAIPAAPEQLADWERYRQPFNMEDKRPRIAVVVSGLGLSDSATEVAIEQLPGAVTLSFSPYARGLERWIALARSRGHEVLIDLPMEPTTFPNEDPGPQALLTSLTPQENLDRLDWVLGRGSAYVGVAGSMGSRFTASRAAIEPILQEVKQRGLLFVDRRSTEESLVAALASEIGLPHAINDRSIDERQASRVAIDARLAQIERIALTDGVAVAMGQPYPVTLERLAEWSGELAARGFAVAPISAVVGLQKAP